MGKDPEKVTEESVVEKRIKALLVDDNYEFFTAISPVLSTHMDCEYASDGFTAFQMVKRDNFDIIICDINMPMINGLNLLQEFKKKYIGVLHRLSTFFG